MVSGVLKSAPELLAPIAAVYSQRLEQFGAKPRGVFWRNADGQRLRFDILSAIFDADADKGGVTLNDLGCGYGAYFDYLKDQPPMRDGRYYGYDISEDMVARAKHDVDDPRATFLLSPTPTRDADYSVASGTYNMRMNIDDEPWAEYVRASLTHLWSRSHKGMAFNMLSAYGGKRLSDLYYADPRPYFDFCMRKLSRNVVLIHDYSLDEWTLFVRR
jgi:SAM-dependent methyltransferase